MAVLSLSLVACGSDQQDSDQTETNATDDGGNGSITIESDDGNVTINADNLEDAIKQATESMGGDPDAEVMNFRDLKAILPDRLLRMDRTEHTGETTGAFGMKFSTAEATYEEDDRRLKVTIMDAVKMGVAQLGISMWAQVDIDRESDDGFERTTTINGDKAYEKYNSRTGDSELALFYKGRYLVSLDGRNLDMDDLHDALDDIDLDDLD